MYIKLENSGYKGTSQYSRGLFLMLITDKTKPQPKVLQGEHWEVRGLVRHVVMEQFGHFMMGYAHVKGERLILSGAYGSDGLLLDVSPKVFAEGYPLPEELYQAWAKGDGWNGAGNEAHKMRQWALENLDKLYKVKGKGK